MHCLLKITRVPHWGCQPYKTEITGCYHRLFSLAIRHISIRLMTLRESIRVQTWVPIWYSTVWDAGLLKTLSGAAGSGSLHLMYFSSPGGKRPSRKRFLNMREFLAGYSLAFGEAQIYLKWAETWFGYCPNILQEYSSLREYCCSYNYCDNRAPSVRYSRVFLCVQSSSVN